MSFCGRALHIQNDQCIGCDPVTKSNHTDARLNTVPSIHHSAAQEWDGVGYGVRIPPTLWRLENNDKQTTTTTQTVSYRILPLNAPSLVSITISCVYFVCFVFVSCFIVVLLWARWGGPDGIEVSSLEPIFLQCFDAVGWVIWPVKTVPNMTYNVFGGTLNMLYLSITIIIKLRWINAPLVSSASDVTSSCLSPSHLESVDHYYQHVILLVCPSFSWPSFSVWPLQCTIGNKIW